MAAGPIFWHQGLYLQPQHFQATDQRNEAMLAELAAMIRPWFWGVRKIDLDKGALAAGALALARFSGIFPDSGVWIDIPGNAVCAGRILNYEDSAADEQLLVYAGLARLYPGQANVTMAESPENFAQIATRYGLLTNQEAMNDLYENAPPAQARTLTHVVRLVLETEKETAGDMLLMPVARLFRQGKLFVEDESYAPPALFMEDSPLLWSLLREIRDRTIAKTGQLDSYKSLAQRSYLPSEMTALFMILSALSRFSARLDLALEGKRLPLWQGYALLREMVGELSVFSQEYNPLGKRYDSREAPTPYDHYNPAPAFVFLRDLLLRMLNSLAAGPRYMIAFSDVPPFKKVEIKPNILDNVKSGDEYWLLLRSNSFHLENMTASIDKQLKLAASGNMGAILSHALPGIPLNRQKNPPLGVGRQEGAVYLRIDQSSPLWADVPRQRELSLSWRDAPDDLEAFFVVVGS
jgi:type VI secretion system protein ImpJ